jgi:hypothetical protein
MNLFTFSYSFYLSISLPSKIVTPLASVIYVLLFLEKIYCFSRNFISQLKIPNPSKYTSMNSTYL